MEDYKHHFNYGPLSKSVQWANMSEFIRIFDINKNEFIHYLNVHMYNRVSYNDDRTVLYTTSSIQKLINVILIFIKCNFEDIYDENDELTGFKKIDF